VDSVSLLEAMGVTGNMIREVGKEVDMQLITMIPSSLLLRMISSMRVPFSSLILLEVEILSLVPILVVAVVVPHTTLPHPQLHAEQLRRKWATWSLRTHNVLRNATNII